MSTVVRRQAGPTPTIARARVNQRFSAADIAAIKEKLAEIDAEEEKNKVIALPDLGRRVIAREARRRARIRVNQF